MKNLILGTLALFCLFACEDDPTIIEEFAAPILAGEWQLVEQKISNGGPASWQKVENGDRFTLNTDGTFTGFQLFSDCQTGTYEASADELTLTYDCADSKPFTYSLQKDDKAIILSPKTVICFETCEYKYEKTDK